MLFSHSATLLDPTAFSQPFLIHLCYPIHISFYKFCFWDYNLIASLLSSFSFLWNPPISLHLTFCFLNSGTLVSMYLWNTMWQRWAVPLSSLLLERLWGFQLYLHYCYFRRAYILENGKRWTLATFPQSRPRSADPVNAQEHKWSQPGSVGLPFSWWYSIMWLLVVTELGSLQYPWLQLMLCLEFYGSFQLFKMAIWGIIILCHFSVEKNKMITVSE